MADQLATPEDLASLLQQDLDAATATLLVECATAVVQAATGQRLVEATSTIDLIGDIESWLYLPQRPVQTVTSVQLDTVTLAQGTTDTSWQQFGARLYRRNGWAACADTPSRVAVTYTHGYPDGDQALQLARSAVLGLAAGAYTNPSGVTQERIDDYSATYEAMTARMDTTSNLKAALRRQYGRRVGAVRIG